MLVLRGLTAFIATIPWPTLRRCQHKWHPRTYPWACEHCGRSRAWVAPRRGGYSAVGPDVRPDAMPPGRGSAGR
jgi:hypothetical protein